VAVQYIVGCCKSLNSLFTRFLKRYLRIPKFVSNAVVHHITGTIPLLNRLIGLANSTALPASFPLRFSSVRLEFLSKIPANSEYSPFPLIDSVFWSRPVLGHIPSNPRSRAFVVRQCLGPFLDLDFVIRHREEYVAPD